MTVPTRIIETEEFNQILNQEEGDVIILHKIVPIYYVTDGDGNLGTKSAQPMYVLFVNVTDPLIYKDQDARRILILANAYEDWTYDLIKDLHVRSDADGYCVSINEWQADDWDYPLEFAQYFFRDDDVKLGIVDIENVLPLEERGLVH